MTKRKSKGRKAKEEPKSAQGGAFSFLRDRKAMAAIAITAVLLLLVVGGIYLKYRTGPGDDGKQYIDRTIIFPKDEGKHDEPYESWTISLHLTTTAGASISASTTYSNQEEDITKTTTLTDSNAITGKNFRAATVPNGALSSSSDGLNLSWSMGQQRDSIFAMKGMTDEQTDSVYSYSAEYWDDAARVLSLDCMIYNRKAPVLYGADGKMFFYDLGTLYGYFQPRVNVRGNITLEDGTVEFVDGYGWMEHTWGFYTLTDIEVLHLQLRNDIDIRIIRAYAGGSDTPGLEYYYYIRPDGSFDITQWQPDKVSSLNVLADGSYTNIDTVQYYFYPERYEKAPWDPYNIAAMAIQWRLVSEVHGLDLRVAATFPQQFTMTGGWGGSVSLNNDLGTVGKGYASLNHPYQSKPEINDVRTNRWKLDLPGDPTEVSANITNGISYEYIRLIYKVDGGEENIVNMHPEEMEINVWKGTIPGISKLRTVVEYKIAVLDLAGSEAETEWYSYTILVE